MLSVEPGVKLHELAPEFLALLEDFARGVTGHRYGIQIHVTSANRPGDTGAHGYGRAVDIRSRLPGWETPEKQIQLALFIAAMWGAYCVKHGYDPDEWGIGYYALSHAQPHIHLDVRPHVNRDLYAAVWVQL
ncbi:MAG: hypothetical protein KatS3mg109_1349 [Pirellulaceae bacterium]|nr:MAG: hypothetical protein KatS3mg109_1211 [Pirellulaceae bacterium]GIW90917.1 MAG: hypothetical protein KatS3mg109_1349 [Pirellulaceae bacterium]